MVALALPCQVIVSSGLRAQPSATAGTAAQAIPCKPDDLPKELLSMGPTGVAIPNPATTEVLEDHTVTDPIDIQTEYPSLLNGTDQGLANPNCTASFDGDPTLPPMVLPSGTLPQPPTLPMLPGPGPHLPVIAFVAPTNCLRADKPGRECGLPLDCRLPFCGRDIIFVDGLATKELWDLIQARHGLGLPATARALQRWPQSPAAFTGPSGYFRSVAEQDWYDFIQRKLGPAFRGANVSYGPRFLIAPWASTQRMEFAVHAVLAQIAQAIQFGTNVKTLNMSDPAMPTISANLSGPGFCGRGCVVVSYSTGGPISVAAMNIAANAGRSWVSSGLRMLPMFIKGHVAFHPALAGSEIAWHVIEAANGTTGTCALAVDLFNGLANSTALSGISGCIAANDLNHSVLFDLAPPVMSLLWRPTMAAVPGTITTAVPTVVVAGAHPTSLAAFHWMAPVLPGYDDGVVSVDSQLGRFWAPALMPRSLAFGAWIPPGIKYYDRGSPTAKAIPYFLDQNHELARRPLSRAAAPNLYLSPNGMVLPSVSLFELPGASSGLPNVFSFLQSTASHVFLLNVGSLPDSQPNDASDGCAAGSYSYRPTGNYFGPQASVDEESRAVFDASVYTTRGRNHFALRESATGPIPLLAPSLIGAIEGEAKGRYMRIRFKLLHIDKTFWIWKREYIRMRGWRCRDEIDYALDFAFRR
jgi:hypothetical protein